MESLQEPVPTSLDRLFEIETYNWLNIPQVVREGLLVAHNRLDQVAEAQRKMRLDIDRVIKEARMSQEKQVLQFDAIRQAIADLKGEGSPVWRRTQSPSRLLEGEGEAVVPKLPASGREAYTRTRTRTRGRLAQELTTADAAGGAATFVSEKTDGGFSDASPLASEGDRSPQHSAATAAVDAQIVEALAASNASLAGGIGNLQTEVKALSARLEALDVSAVREEGFPKQLLEDMPKWLHRMGATHEPTPNGARLFLRDVARAISAAADVKDSLQGFGQEQTGLLERMRQLEELHAEAAQIRQRSASVSRRPSKACSDIEALSPRRLQTALGARTPRLECLSERSQQKSADEVSDTSDGVPQQELCSLPFPGSPRESGPSCPAAIEQLHLDPPPVLDATAHVPVVEAHSQQAGSAVVGNTSSCQAGGSHGEVAVAKASPSSTTNRHAELPGATLAANAAAHPLPLMTAMTSLDTKVTAMLQQAFNEAIQHHSHMDEQRARTTESLAGSPGSMARAGRALDGIVTAFEKSAGITKEWLEAKLRQEELARQVLVKKVQEDVSADMQERFAKLRQECQDLASQVQKILPSAMAQAASGKEASLSDARWFSLDVRIKDVEEQRWSMAKEHKLVRDQIAKLEKGLQQQARYQASILPAPDVDRMEWGGSAAHGALETPEKGLNPNQVQRLASPIMGELADDGEQPALGGGIGYTSLRSPKGSSLAQRATAPSTPSSARRRPCSAPGTREPQEPPDLVGMGVRGTRLMDTVGEEGLPCAGRGRESLAQVAQQDVASLQASQGVSVAAAANPLLSQRCSPDVASPRLESSLKVQQLTLNSDDNVNGVNPAGATGGLVTERSQGKASATASCQANAPNLSVVTMSMEGACTGTWAVASRQAAKPLTSRSEASGGRVQGEQDVETELATFLDSRIGRLDAGGLAADEDFAANKTAGEAPSHSGGGTWLSSSMAGSALPPTAVAAVGEPGAQGEEVATVCGSGYGLLHDPQFDLLGRVLPPMRRPTSALNGVGSRSDPVPLPKRSGRPQSAQSCTAVPRGSAAMPRRLVVDSTMSKQSSLAVRGVAPPSAIGNGR